MTTHKSTAPQRSRQRSGPRDLPDLVELASGEAHQHRLWLERNCHRCASRRPSIDLASSAENCPMAEALTDEAVLGAINAFTARRFGASIVAEAATLPHDCPRFARRRGRAA